MTDHVEVRVPVAVPRPSEPEEVAASAEEVPE